MEYTFADALGRQRTVTGSMKNPPPERFVEDGIEWARVYDASTLPRVSIGRGTAVDHRPTATEAIGQASYSLPPNDSPFELVNRNGHTVRRHQDGTYSTAMGRRIMDGQRAADAAKRDGFVKDD